MKRRSPSPCIFQCPFRSIWFLHTSSCVAWADQLSGFLHKKCCFVQPGFTWGCRLIYIQGWLGLALSCSAHMRNCFLPSSLGFAGMQREQKGLEMTSVDSEWWLMCLWRVDASLNTVKSRLTWQSQLVCSPNPSTVGIHGNTVSTCPPALSCSHSTHHDIECICATSGNSFDRVILAANSPKIFK